jgi:hypothetical protein
MRITAGFTGAIASAVAGEVNRLDQHPKLWRSEGGAYKAAWDRAGGDALHCCDDFEADCDALEMGMRLGARRLVRVQTDALLVADRRQAARLDELDLAGVEVLCARGFSRYQDCDSSLCRERGCHAPRIGVRR